MVKVVEIFNDSDAQAEIAAQCPDESTSNQCGAEADGWSCTRVEGHDGLCVAYGLDATKPFAYWPSQPEVVTAEEG